MCNKKPAKWMKHLTGQGRDIAAFTLIRKGQAFKSPLHPNKRTGTVNGIVSLRSDNGGALCKRLHGIASLPTAKRKLNVGCNRERPRKYQLTSIEVSISDGLAPRFIGKLSNWRHEQGF